MSRHMEIHLVTSVRESVLLAQGGLPHVHLEPMECGACTRPIGEDGTGHFVPVAVILDPHSLAYLCESCLHPLLKVLPDVDSRSIQW